MDPVTTVTPDAAPAQPAPAPVSATRAAADTGDFAAFEKAHTAARAGHPLPDVATPAPKADAAPAAPTQPAPTAEVSKRQQDINDRIRDAVTRATADKDAEIARLKGSSAAPAQPEAPKADAAKVPEWKRYASLPDFPKLPDFDSIEDHAAAAALFIADKRYEERATEASNRTEQEQVESVHRARAESFFAKLDAAKTADPEFVTKLSPEVKALKPISGLAPGEASGPLNILWERVYDSPLTDKLLLHFSQHPDALRQFETLPPEIAALPPALRVRAHIPVILEQFGELVASLRTPAAPQSVPALPSTISAAPPPAPTLSKAGATADPAASAVKRGDFAAFDRLEQQRLRQRRSA